MSFKSQGRFIGCLATAGLMIATPADAQGNLSSQGLGYPVGQLSARAVGVGGALSQLDPSSPQNPAALATWGSSGVLIQFGPEIRRVSVGGVGERTSVIRFPIVGTVMAAHRFTVGLGASTLTDRSWHTRSPATYVVGTDTVSSESDVRSTGSLTDIRLASSYVLAPGLYVGLGAHVITGEHRETTIRSFSRVDFATVQEQTRVSYAGSALSAGVVWRVGPDWLVGASGRLGGKITGRDTALTGQANLPDGAGASVAYGGLSGVLLAASGTWDGWSRVAGLDPGLTAQNTHDIGLGAEVDGPTMSGTAVKLRLGGQWRTLPFPAAGAAVSERSVAGGATLPLGAVAGFPRALVDVGLSRAHRTAGAGVSEGAWIVSIGLSIRPQ